MRTAIIDLGTNTFNIVIVESLEENNYNILYKDKQPANLGHGGITNDIITTEAYQRGMAVLSDYQYIIQKYEAQKVCAFATSALRNAVNKQDFINSVKEKFGYNIQIISGNEEAELIYKGVKQAVQLPEEKILIINIGGGSDEFIIANNEHIFWKQSFKLGIARIMEKFHPSDPLKPKEAEAIEKYLESNLHPLFEALGKYPCKTLIGSSGSFDTFAKIIAHKSNTIELFRKHNQYEIDLGLYSAMHKELIRSTKEEREQMKGLEIMRIEMIHLASVLVNLIIKKAGITKLIQSGYSFKEGIITCIDEFED